MISGCLLPHLEQYFSTTNFMALQQLGTLLMSMTCCNITGKDKVGSHISVCICFFKCSPTE